MRKTSWSGQRPDIASRLPCSSVGQSATLIKSRSLVRIRLWQQNLTGLKYEKESPCGNCPYRKDAPLRLWSVEEFYLLTKNENSELGAIYGCHKKDGHVCRGFLMNQVERNIPSIMLRLDLIKEEVSKEYLDRLNCKKPMFSSVEEMCEKNYPEKF